jgi:hypothetical protein
MTSHAGRLYALALALLVFFLAWAAIAAKPWTKTATDSRAQALALREKQLRHESALVRQIVRQRAALYRQRLRVRQSAIAAARQRQQQLISVQTSAPAVRVVNLPPLTVTRTS